MDGSEVAVIEGVTICCHHIHGELSSSHRSPRHISRVSVVCVVVENCVKHWRKAIRARTCLDLRDQGRACPYCVLTNDDVDEAIMVESQSMDIKVIGAGLVRKGSCYFD